MGADLARSEPSFLPPLPAHASHTMFTPTRPSVCFLFVVALALGCGDDDTPASDAGPAVDTLPFDASDARDGSRDTGIDVDAGPDETPPDWGDSMLVATEVTERSVALRWDAATDRSGIARYVLLRDGAMQGETSATTFVDNTVSPGLVYEYALRAIDNAGNETLEGPSLVVTTTLVTPDPGDVAPALDPEAYPGFVDRVSFLWEGVPAVQTDVADGAIDPARVSVMQGRVLDEEGTPLAGVTLRALHQMGVGKTTTREDGRFDLAFNGGGRTTLTFAIDGRLPAQRSLLTYYNDFYLLDDVLESITSTKMLVEEVCATLEATADVESTTTSWTDNLKPGSASLPNETTLWIDDDYQPPPPLKFLSL